MKEFLAGLFAGVGINVLADELIAWMPRLAQSIATFNARRLPDTIADRLRDEWLSTIEDIPGPFTKLLFAIDLCRAVPCLRREFASGPIVSLHSRLVAVLLAIALAPVIALVACAVKLFAGKGRILVTVPVRVRGAEPIEMIIFRTRDEHGEITKIGSWLRRLKLNLLPILMYVIVGKVDLRFRTFTKTSGR